MPVVVGVFMMALGWLTGWLTWDQNIYYAPILAAVFFYWLLNGPVLQNE